MNSTKMKQGRFECEGIEGTFKGWSDGLTWNGFELPAFELEQALEIIAKARENDDEALPLPEDYPNGFNEESRSLFMPEGEIVNGRTIETEDGSSHEVFDVGAYLWCWSKAL